MKLILQSQLNSGAINKVQVESSGSIEDSKPIALAFLKGFLAKRIPDRVNYINAETLAVDLGISIEHSYTNDSGSYTNLIRTKVSGANKPSIISGSVFEGGHPRLVNILGYEISFTSIIYIVFDLVIKIIVIFLFLLNDIETKIY